MKRAFPPSHILIITLLLLIAGGGVIFSQETHAEKVGAYPTLEVPDSFKAQPQLSVPAELYLVTIYPGEALYSSFGHTAIRIKDPSAGIDILYNYGQSSIPFDSGFVPHFVKGQLPFMLGVVNAERAYNFYIKYEDRTIYEQKLNLSLKEKTELYSFLAHNALPENRVYIYDFFFDNCTTRVRDIFTYLYGSSLRYSLPEQNKSFREIIAPYLSHTPYVTLGINLMFGSPSDKKPDLEDRLFLPFQLMDAAETAVIQAAQGNTETAEIEAGPRKNEKSPVPAKTQAVQEQTVPAAGPDSAEGSNESARGSDLSRGRRLESETRFIYRQKRGDPEPPALGPGLLLWFLAAAAAAVSLSPYRRSLSARIMDILIFGLIGILGSLMLLLWFFSGYEMATSNYNLLWAWPTHLAVVFIGFASVRRHRFLFYYFAAAAAAAFLYIAASPLIPQTLPSAAVPLILALGVRSVSRIILLPRTRVVETHTSR